MKVRIMNKNRVLDQIKINHTTVIYRRMEAHLISVPQVVGGTFNNGVGALVVSGPFRRFA